MVPVLVRNPRSPATVAKNANTSIAPATAPSSGRASSFLRIPTLRTLSSAGRAAVAIVDPPFVAGAAPKAAPLRNRLADALLAEVDDLLGVVLGDEGRAGQHLGSGYRAVLGVVGQEDDRQVPLEVLLLVHGEGHVTVVDGLQDRGSQIEGGERDVLLPTALLEGCQGRLGAGRAERQHAVEIRVL